MVENCSKVFRHGVRCCPLVLSVWAMGLCPLKPCEVVMASSPVSPSAEQVWLDSGLLILDGDSLARALVWKLILQLVPCFSPSLSSLSFQLLLS